MAFHHLSVAHEEGVGTVTLMRPPINAINGQVLDEIVTALEAWTDDPPSRRSSSPAGSATRSAPAATCSSSSARRWRDWDGRSA